MEPENVRGVGEASTLEVVIRRAAWPLGLFTLALVLRAIWMW